VVWGLLYRAEQELTRHYVSRIASLLRRAGGGGGEWEGSRSTEPRFVSSRGESGSTDEIDTVTTGGIASSILCQRIIETSSVKVREIFR
jgi:hypothetical protein